MIKVYIASPYTKGDVAVNVKRQIDTADELMTLGFCPFAPVLCHFHHLVHPRTYKEWTRWGLEWVLACDAILRLEGDSVGADKEVWLASQNHIPIFFSINELLAWRKQ